MLSTDFIQPNSRIIDNPPHPALPPQSIFAIIFMKQVHGKLIVKIVHALPQIELMGTRPKLIATNLHLQTTAFTSLCTGRPEQFRPQSSATTRRRDSQFHNFTDTRRMMKLKLHPQVDAADDPMLRLIYQAIILESNIFLFVILWGLEIYARLYENNYSSCLF